MLKRILALVLALALCAGLCACGSKTVVMPFSEEETDSPTQTQTETETQTQMETQTQTGGAPDYAAAWASHSPEETAFTVDGAPVTWRELFYEICYCALYLENRQGAAITDWNAPSSFRDEDGAALTCGQVVLDNALSLLTQYHVMYDRLSAAGVTLSAEILAEVDKTEQDTIDNSFSGDKERFLAYLENLGCTEKLWRWFVQVDAMYSLEGFAALYGEDGASMSDEQTMAYAEDYGYVNILQLRLSKQQDDAAAGAERADAIVQRLAACASDPEKATVFWTLYGMYNDDASLDRYLNGRCLFEGDTDDAVYQAAVGLADYAVTTAQTDDAVVVLMAVPMGPDADVYYDEEAGVMRSLRYYAAWQDFSDCVNGENGWIASADVRWAAGFEGFTLDSVF